MDDFVKELAAIYRTAYDGWVPAKSRLSSELPRITIANVTQFIALNYMKCLDVHYGVCVSRNELEKTALSLLYLNNEFDFLTLKDFLEQKRQTIVYNQMHQSFPLVGEMAQKLTDALGYFTNINGYLAREGAVGAACHEDEYDVLIVQLEGQKRWKLYGLAGTNLEYDWVLSPGEVLYVPHGHYHKVQVLPGQECLHLTIGVIPELDRRKMSENSWLY